MNKNYSYINLECFNNLEINQNNLQKFYFQSKSSYILPCFENKNVYIYNGKKFNLLKITTDMIGYKFGEFILTKKKPVYTKKKKILKKKVKK
jgi:ribosomal protein S19